MSIGNIIKIYLNKYIDNLILIIGEKLTIMMVIIHIIYILC